MLLCSKGASKMLMLLSYSKLENQTNSRKINNQRFLNPVGVLS